MDFLAKLTEAARFKKALLAIATIAVLLIYARTMNFPFHFDDSHTIVNNQSIHSPDNLLKLWTSGTYFSNAPDNWGYRPLITFINSLCWQAGGGSPWPFHLVKILALIGLTYLLSLMWLRLWRMPGFVGARGAEELPYRPETCALIFAAFFAVHPANVEIATYIISSTTLLAAFFMVLSFYAYLKYRLDLAPARWLAVAVLAFFAGTLCKEEAITVVGLVAFFELFLRWERLGLRASPVFANPEGRRRGLYALAALVMAALASVVLLRVMFEPTSSIARGNVPRFDYFMTQWRAYLHYIQMAFWPFEFNADNLAFGFSNRLLEVSVLRALAGNLLLVGIAWKLRYRHPIALFALIWFYVAISPASSVIPLSEPVNDRRMSTALLGLWGGWFPLLLMGLTWLMSQGAGAGEWARRGRAAVLVLLWTACAVGATVRTQVWSSSETLWTDTIEKNPQSVRAYNNLSLVYMARADYAKAEELLLKCKTLGSLYSTCFVNLAITYGAMGKDKEAENEFKLAVVLEPSNPSLQNRFGEFFFRRGMFSEALDKYRLGESLSSGHNFAARFGVLQTLVSLGKWAEARTAVNSALVDFGPREDLRALDGVIPAAQ